MTWTLPDERAGQDALPDLVERRALVGGADDQQVIADGVTAEETEIGGVPCAVCAPASPVATLVYFHGGYRLGTARLARVRSSPRRRREHSRHPRRLPPGPRAPVPGRVAGCARRVRRRRHRRRRPGLRGRRLRRRWTRLPLRSRCLQRGGAVPAGLVLISPWVDLTQTAGTYESRAETDVMFPKASADGAAALVLQGHDPRDPLVSPQFADVRLPVDADLRRRARDVARRLTRVRGTSRAAGSAVEARGRFRPAARLPVPARERGRSRRAAIARFLREG